MTILRCPVCGSGNLVLDQTLKLSKTQVRNLFLHAVCLSCNAPLTVEFEPKNVRTSYVD